MNITLQRSELSDAVSRAVTVAPPASPVRELEGVLLETGADALTVTATNLEIALQQRLPCLSAEDDALVVSAALFNAMLRKLAGDTVTLRRAGDESALFVESGDAAYSIPTMNCKGYPRVEIPFPEDTIPVSGIPALVRRTVFAVYAQNDNPLLQCVNLKFTRDGLVGVGCDGLRMISAKGDPKSTGDVSLLVPARSLAKLARISGDGDEYRVGTTGRSIVFSRSGMIFTARIMEADYVDTDRIIGSLQNAFTVLTDIAELRKAMDAVMQVDPSGSVCLSFQDDRLTFSARGAFGNAATAITVTALRGTPSGQYWQTSKKLYDCLRVLSGTATLGVAQGGMLTLSTEDAFYLQPSVRPPKQRSAPEQPEETAKKEPSKRRPKKAA